MATFAEMLGQPLPEDAGPDSFSFFSVLKGTKSHKGTTSDGPIREHLVIPAGNKTLSIRQGKWKLIQKTDDRTAENNRLELYDLESDIGETTDVAKANPEIVEALLKQVENARSDIGDYNRVGKGARFFDDGPRRSDVKR